MDIKYKVIFTAAFKSKNELRKKRNQFPLRAHQKNPPKRAE